MKPSEVLETKGWGQGFGSNCMMASVAIAYNGDPMEYNRVVRALCAHLRLNQVSAGTLVDWNDTLDRKADGSHCGVESNRRVAWMYRG